MHFDSLKITSDTDADWHDALACPVPDDCIEHFHAHNGVRELRELLSDDTFHERFINVQTQKQRSELQALEQRIDRKLIFRSVSNQIRKDSRERGEELTKEQLLALAEQSSVVVDGREYKLCDQRDREQLRIHFAGRYPDYKNLYPDARLRLEYAIKKAEDALQSLRAELELRKDDPRLLQAMELWGVSRNADGDTNNGFGYHAGVVHYFNYRSYVAKNKRYQDQALSIEEFIELTESFRPLLRREGEAAMHYGLVFQDEKGQQRVIARTKSHLMVAFKRVNRPLRLLTLIPNKPDWQKRENIPDRIQRELGNVQDDQRFNRLSSERSLVAAVGIGDYLLP